MSQQEHKLALPTGTELQQYRIESVLGAGGFGVVYKARHKHLDSYVAIKEYLPQHCSTREGVTVHPLSSSDDAEFEQGIQKFLEEAKQLVQFDDHPNIIRCKDFFKENGTAYLVMNLEVGKELAQILKSHALSNQPLTEQQIVDIVVPVLEGLKYIHSRDVLHRDIKPANIFVRAADSRPLLIDFGAAKQNFGSTQKSENQTRTVGYAPMEQETQDGELGPWTDLHAVGAMMWRIVANENPPGATDRWYKHGRGQADPVMTKLEGLRGQYSDRFLHTVAKAMALDHGERFQSAQEFIAALGAAQTASSQAVASYHLDEDKTQKYEGPIFTQSPKSVSAAESAAVARHASAGIPSAAGANSINTSEAGSAQNSQPKSSFNLVLLAMAGAIAVLVGVFWWTNGGTGQPNTDETVARYRQDIEVVYQQMSDAERLRDKSVFDAENAKGLCMAVGDDMDNSTRRMISNFVSATEKRNVDMGKFVENARDRTYVLTTNFQKNEALLVSTFTDVTKVAEQSGNYTKSTFLAGHLDVLKEAAALSGEAAIRKYIAGSIQVDPVRIDDYVENCNM